MMEMGGSPSDEAFARYLSGESTPDERAAVEAWMADDFGRQSMLAQMTTAWNAPRQSLDSWDRDRLHGDFLARRDGVATQAPSQEMGWITPRRHGRWNILAGVAALVVCVMAFGMWRMHERSSVVTPSQVASNPVEDWKFTTAPGQRATITLADGSTVTLGVSSRLTPGAGFGATTRDVYLEGEAYFEVAADAHLPFVVHVGNTATRVLGTAFDVRKYTGDATVQVAVASGRVAVGVGESTTLLAAGDLGRIDEAGQSQVVHDANAVEAVTAWRNGWVRLDGVTLPEAAAELSRWYDLDIAVGDQTLLHRTITASFHNETPSAVVQYIADALGARVERRGRQVTFFAR
jgi:ferric-dicitrate binding protein FerR (iron transport regulator)